jgi:hypothetical protein
VKLRSKLKRRWFVWKNAQRIQRLARQVSANTVPHPNQAPVILFNASSRLTAISQNAAFSMLTSWGLRLAGVPTIHFVCRAGMSRCVMGTAWNINRQQVSTHSMMDTKYPSDARTSMPCRSCLTQSRLLHAGANIIWFDFQPDDALTASLQNLSVKDMSTFEYGLPEAMSIQRLGMRNQQSTISNQSSKIPLGKLVLPSLRWTLRRYTLEDDEDTRFLYSEFILSAFNVARQFAVLVEKTKPSAAVIFNGLMFPEAVARWVAIQMGIRAITHEACFQRFSAFFSEGEATAYPIHIPDEFELTPDQNALLDAYLEKRFQGNFSMAGIRFWPEMCGLDEAFLQKVTQYQQIVPIFTNVIYDTSQVHADRVFTNMFEWLELILELIQKHPETLFVIRAHPDEMRPGTAKQSRESVRDWVLRHGVHDLRNVTFIDSQEYISSYDLIQRAKFVMVYNSSIGMEATLLGTPVLCAGKARYTQYPMVFFPETPQAYREMAEQYLSVRQIDVPNEFQRNARRFLYYQLYRVSLSFEDFLEEGPRQGFVQLREFYWKALLTGNSPTMNAIMNGIIKGNRFEVAS